MEQVEQLKMHNEDLCARNTALEKENKKLREKYSPGSSKEGAESCQVLFENHQFRILKAYKPDQPRPRHSSSCEKAKPGSVLDLASMVKYTHLLQERIVDGLSLHRTEPVLGSPTSLALGSPTSLVLGSPTSLERIQQPQSPAPPHSATAGGLEDKQDKQVTRETSTRSEINSNSHLQLINSKLSEIRKQRQQMFDDEELWTEVEKLQV